MLCLAVALYCAAPTLAEEPGHHARGGVNLGARIGNDTGEGFVDFVVPLHSNGQSILFLNPRASLKDEGETELNLGLVARKKLPNTDVIIGANAYLDRRESRRGNTFNQTGLGVEALSQWVDARLNYYRPNDDRVMIADAQMTDVDVDVSTSTSASRQSDTETDTSLIDSTTSGGDPRFSGNSILTGGAVTENTLLNTNTTTTRTTTTTTRTIRTTTTDRFFEQFEQGREGWDAELMLRLPLSDGLPQTRLGVGYYDYSSGFNGGEGISGVKGRLEMRAGPFLTLDAEVFEDRELNDTSFFLGARLHLPFDMGRLVNGRNPFSNIKNRIRRHNQAPFNERLDEMVIRDVRIQMEESEFLENREREQQDVEVEVETASSTSTSTTTEKSVVTETSTEPTETITKQGEAVTVVHVDDDNGGDPDNDPGADGGTYENPHADATDTNNDATEADIILVHASSSITGAIQAGDDIRVLGEGDGAVHLVDADQGQIALPETAPGSQGDPRPTVEGVSISSQNVEVSNFTVNSGSISTAAGSTHRDITIRRINSTGNTSNSVISLGAGPGGGLDGSIALSDINIINHTGGSSAIAIQNSLATAQVAGSNINVDGAANNGLFFSGAAAGASHTFSTVDVMNAGGGVGIGGSAGDYTFNDTDITDTNGAAFNLAGGTANVGFDAASSITQGNNQTAVGVSGGHATGTLTYNGVINATNGDGLQFDDADGNYNFTGQATLNGGDAGVDIVGGSAGTFNFANTDITNPSGPAYNEAASTANVTFQADSAIVQNNAASAVAISNKSGGTTTFNGAITANTGTATGVNLAGNTGGTVAFNGGLDIDTTTGNGFNASGGGTVNVLNGTSSNSIATTETAAGAVDGGAALVLSGVSANFVFDTVSATGSAGAGIDVDNLGDGSTLAIGTTTITDADPGAGAGALTIRNNAGAVNLDFGDTTIVDTDIGGGASGNGLFITGNGAATTSTFGDLSITTDNGAGITHNDASALTVTGTTTINANSPGLNLQTSTGTFTFADLDINFTGASRGIDFRNSNVSFDAANTTITGDGTSGSIAIDLSGSMNPDGANSGSSNIRLAGGAGQTAIINNVDTGVLLGDGAGSAGANFVYGNQNEPSSGSQINVIGGGTTLDTTNLISSDPQTQGRYEFLGVDFTGTASFEVASDFYFVAGNAAGAGDGSSLDDRADATQFLADLTANNLSGVTVIGVNDGIIDLGADTAALNSLTNIDGFGNGNTDINVFSVPVNVIVTESNLENDPTVSNNDGAATFTADATSDVFNLNDSHTISNVNISGGDFNIAGDGFQDLTVQGVELGGGAGGVFSFSNTTGNGTIQLTDNTISQNGKRLLEVDGGNSTISLAAGTGSISNTDGSGIDIRNTTGGSVMIDGVSITGADATPLTFDNNAATLSITNNTIGTDAGVTLLDVDTGTGGSTTALTFDGSNTFSHGSGTIADIGAGSRSIDLAAHDFTNTGTTSSNVINSTGQTGGTIAFGNIDIDGFSGAGPAVNLQGSAGTVTFGDLDIATTSGAGLDVGDITFDPGTSATIDASGANALTMNGTTLSGGAATFDSVASSGGVHGIDIDDMTGTLTLATIDIDDSTGDGVSLDNAGSVAINGGTIDGTTGDGINSADTNLTVDGVTLGADTLIGGNGIQVVNTVNASLAIDDTTVAATDAGITVDGSAGGTTTVTSLSDNTVTDAGAGGMLFDTVTFDATPGGGTTIGSLGNRVQGDGLSLSNVFGTLSFDDLDIANNNGTGILVQNSKTNSFTLNVDAGDASNATVDTTNGTAIDLDPLTVNANFTTVNASGATAGSAVNIDTVNGTFNIDGGSLANSNSGSAVVNIESSSVDVAVGASISNPAGSGGNSVMASANTGGTYTFSGNVDDDASGIDITSNTGGAFTFSGASKSLNTGPNNAVNITGNAAGVSVSFTGGGLDIDTTSGTGFNATGGGTVNVTGSGNTVNTTTGTGVNIANTTIGSSGVTFESISANGAVHGIALNNTGSAGDFMVTGDGTLARNGSGGTISGTTGDAVSLIDANNVTLQQMNITNCGDGTAGDDCVDSSGGGDHVLSAVLVSNATGTGANEDFGNGWRLTNVAGDNRIDNDSLFTSFPTASTHAVRLRNTDTDGNLTISDSSFTDQGTGNSATFVTAQSFGTSNVDFTVEGTRPGGAGTASTTTFSGLRGDAILSALETGSSGTMNTIIRNSDFLDAAANGSGAIAATVNEQGATHNVTIEDNVFNNLSTTLAAPVGVITANIAGNGGNLNAIIQRNDLDIVQGSRRGIQVVAQPVAGAGLVGSLTLDINSNTIDRIPGNFAILVDTDDRIGSSTIDITNNEIGQAAGFEGQVGETGDGAMLVRTRGTPAATNTITIRNNSIRLNTNLDSSNDGLGRGVFLDARDDRTSNIDFTGNSIRNDDANSTDPEFFIRAQVGNPTVCLHLDGNNAIDSSGASGSGTYEIRQVDGTVNVEDQANVNARNQGTVTTVGTVGSAADCVP